MTDFREHSAFIPHTPLSLSFPSRIHISPRRKNQSIYTKQVSKACLQQHDTPSSNHDALHWKDRVALYAQFSPEETLHALLQALRFNTRSGPHKDDGIDALYSFANLDIWALTHVFFGRKMDLGQFERFKRVIVAEPYQVMLREYRGGTLSAVRVGESRYVTRRVFEIGDMERVFTFSMSIGDFGVGGHTAWMVDSIIFDGCRKIDST